MIILVVIESYMIEVMKKIYFILVSICVLFVNCNQENTVKVDTKEEVKNIEMLVAKSLSTDVADIKLIGFKTFYAENDDEKNKILELSTILKDSLVNYYFANDGSFFRIYFPLHTAIVSFQDNLYYADEYGVVQAEDGINLQDGKLTVVGRKLSDNVRGTGTNIIKEDHLLLAKPLVVGGDKTRSYYGIKNVDFNYCVFDLGTHNVNHNCCDEVCTLKTRIEEGSGGSGGSGGSISCVKNHGGRNCSDAFGIRNGRCTFNPNVCMDYNGIYTDCVDGKVINFVGSDCSEAMSKGHCWNEIM